MEKKTKTTLKDHLFFHDSPIHPDAEKIFAGLNKKEKAIIVSLCRGIYHMGLTHIENAEVIETKLHEK